jgi:hypothetical protein
MQGHLELIEDQKQTADTVGVVETGRDGFEEISKRLVSVEWGGIHAKDQHLLPDTASEVPKGVIEPRPRILALRKDDNADSGKTPAFSVTLRLLLHGRVISDN